MVSFWNLLAKYETRRESYRCTKKNAFWDLDLKHNKTFRKTKFFRTNFSNRWDNAACSTRSIYVGSNYSNEIAWALKKFEFLIWMLYFLLILFYIYLLAQVMENESCTHLKFETLVTDVFVAANLFDVN